MYLIDNLSVSGMKALESLRSRTKGEVYEPSIYSRGADLARIRKNMCRTNEFYASLDDNGCEIRL